MAAITFQLATRIQESVLSSLEKRALIWLAQRVPLWINSDHLTLLGLSAMIAAGISYWYAKTNPILGLTLATICLGVNWFGDSLDGTVARVRNKLRPRYGFYVDHVVDMIGILFLLGGLALSGYMSSYVALAVLIVYYMLSMECYLATYSLGTFRLSFGGFSPTELRVVLGIGNAVLIFKSEAILIGKRFLIFDVGGTIGAVAMLGVLVYSVVKNTRRLYREEPLS
jgi:phosphatidylglycerophosphate synthase